LLHEYYRNLGKEQLATAKDDKNIALEVLKVRLEAARKRLQFQADNSNLTRRRFEVGNGEVHDVLEAEQAEAMVAAEVQKFEALLRYYEKLGMNDAKPESNPPSVQPQGPDSAED
jgi:hypothetical protein